MNPTPTDSTTERDHYDDFPEFSQRGVAVKSWIGLGLSIFGGLCFLGALFTFAGNQPVRCVSFYLGGLFICAFALLLHYLTQRFDLQQTRTPEPYVATFTELVREFAMLGFVLNFLVGIAFLLCTVAGIRL